MTAVVVCFLFFTGVNLQKNDVSAQLGGSLNVADTDFAGFVTARGGVYVGTSSVPATQRSGVITRMLKGTCNLTGGIIAATSSANTFCAVTGVNPGDSVFVSLATTTLFSGSGIVAGAEASSTPNYITVKLFNMTGAATTTATIGTGVNYFVID